MRFSISPRSKPGAWNWSWPPLTTPGHRQCAHLRARRATKHGIALDVAVDDRLGDFLGDERKIKQILLNLLSNAVKSRPRGDGLA